jgi:hypothetical protein
MLNLAATKLALRTSTLIGAAAFTLGFTLGLPAAWASTINFVATGTDTDGEALDASALFVTKAGELDITLTNLLSPSQIRSEGQAVSDVIFTLSGFTVPFSFVSATDSGQEGRLSKTATGDVEANTSGEPGRFLGNGGGTFSIVAGSGGTEVVTMSALGGSKPTELILPFVANGGSFVNGNPGGDLDGKPFTIGPASFALSLLGVTADTTVSNVQISFGTAPQEVNATSTPSVPLPPALALFGSGLAGLAFLARRKKNRGTLGVE